MCSISVRTTPQHHASSHRPSPPARDGTVRTRVVTTVADWDASRHGETAPTDADRAGGACAGMSARPTRSVRVPKRGGAPAPRRRSSGGIDRPPTRCSRRHGRDRCPAPEVIQTGVFAPVRCRSDTRVSPTSPAGVSVARRAPHTPESRWDRHAVTSSGVLAWYSNVRRTTLPSVAVTFTSLSFTL